MYKIGDYVIYRQWRVCVIEGMETPSFERRLDRKYYKMRPAFDDISDTTIYVPVDGAESLRALFDKATVRQAFAQVKEMPVTVVTVKKIVQLTAHYETLLLGADLKEYVYLLKEVTTKEKTVKKLSEIDLRYRKKAEKLLAEVWAIAFDCSLETAKRKINEEIQ